MVKKNSYRVLVFDDHHEILDLLKIVFNNLALMSGDFSNEDEQKAKELGLKFFKKPFELPEVFEWLDKIEHHINPQRRLTDFKNLCNYAS